jgi:SHS2 domain-containing protein
VSSTPSSPRRAGRRAGRGHRAVPHTADVIVEAWGPDLPACFEEAAAGLAAVYVDAARAREIGRHPVHLGPGPPDALLVDLVEEAIFALDTAPGVPFGAEVSAAQDGGLDVELALADPDTVTATGSVPKAVSRSELAVAAGPGGVRCRFLVDV